MDIIFIRHGQAESNVLPEDVGVVGSDRSLTLLGCAQTESAALKVGDILHRLNLQTPAFIYSSPYKRTIETAEIIARSLGAKIVLDERLREVDRGSWVGKTVADVVELERSVPSEERHTFKPPDGENWPDIAERMLEFIEQHIKSGSAWPLVIVSHNHPIECAIGKLTGIDMVEWKDRPVDNASITRAYLDGEIWMIDEDIYNVKPEPKLADNHQ